MSDQYWQRRALQCIAQGALTNSKRPESHIEGVYPTHAEKAHGCHIWDPDGKKYVDFICGLGTNLLGYGNEAIAQAVAGRTRLGVSMSLSSLLEIRVGEKAKELFPFVDAWKFLKTGSEACAAAIKIARAHTGRNLVLSEAYHGWSDDFVSLTEPAKGVPRGPLYPRAIDKLANVDIWDNVAAVIIEPVVTDFSTKRIFELQALREKCDKYGVMLIFDEVITNCRVPKYSVAAHTGILPDLFCIGKAFGNGFPIAAVGGKYAAMHGDYFVSSTYAGDQVSLAAANKTMELLQEKYDVKRLWDSGAEWVAEFNTLWPEKIKIEGYGTRGRFVGDEMAKALFFQEAVRAGMLFGPSWFWNFPLMEADVMNDIRVIFRKLKSGNVTLDGKLPQSPFAERTRHGQESKKG